MFVIFKINNCLKSYQERIRKLLKCHSVCIASLPVKTVAIILDFTLTLSARRKDKVPWTHTFPQYTRKGDLTLKASCQNTNSYMSPLLRGCCKVRFTLVRLQLGGSTRMDCESPGAESNWECLCSSCPPAATETEPLCCRGFHQGMFVFVSGERRCVTMKDSKL